MRDECAKRLPVSLTLRWGPRSRKCRGFPLEDITNDKGEIIGRRCPYGHSGKGGG